MFNKNSTPLAVTTIEFNGLLVSTRVHSFTPARPAPFAQTPDSPGYSDEGDTEEIEYEATTEVTIDCAETFLDWLNLEENEEFRAKLLEEMLDV